MFNGTSLKGQRRNDFNPQFMSLTINLTIHAHVLTNYRCHKIKHLEMWWLFGSAPDFWGRSPGFESDVSHSDPDNGLDVTLAGCSKLVGITTTYRVLMDILSMKTKDSYIEYGGDICQKRLHLSNMAEIQYLSKKITFIENGRDFCQKDYIYQN